MLLNQMQYTEHAQDTATQKKTKYIKVSVLN